MHGNILQLIFDFPRECKNLYRESRSLDHRRRGGKERQEKKKKKATGKLAQHCQPHTQLAAYVPQTETAHLCLIADFLHSNPISSSATNPAAPHRSFDELASYAVRLCITTARGAAAGCHQHAVCGSNRGSQKRRRKDALWVGATSKSIVETPVASPGASPWAVTGAWPSLGWLSLKAALQPPQTLPPSQILPFQTLLPSQMLQPPEHHKTFLSRCTQALILISSCYCGGEG